MKETKECTNCNEIKPLVEFNKHYRTKDRLSYYCKDCLHIKQKKYYIGADETVNTVGRVKSYKKVLLQINDIRLLKECIDSHIKTIQNDNSSEYFNTIYYFKLIESKLNHAL